MKNAKVMFSIKLYKFVKRKKTIIIKNDIDVDRRVFYFPVYYDYMYDRRRATVLLSSRGWRNVTLCRASHIRLLANFTLYPVVYDK